MRHKTSLLREELSKALLVALGQALKDGAPSPAEIDASFEIPREEKFGELSSNIVFKIAKENKTSPRALAETVKKSFDETLVMSPLAKRVEKITVEGPGFINFYVTQSEKAAVLFKIQSEGERFGRSQPAQKKNILLEYVSANPTGPLTVAHGRQAALGDSLARIMRFRGHQVTTEYYNNDEGVQINTLAASLRMRVERLVTQKDLDAEPPENYYRGEYLVEIAKAFIEQYRPTAPFEKYQKQFQTFARDLIMSGIRKDLADFDVHFDNYYSQEALGQSGRIERTLEELKKTGKVYESEGAVWFRSTDFGDDKDRVLIKSDGHYTYLTPDIAYHHEKFERGFDTLVDILGPDHHGYIARLKASQEALGHDASRLHVLIAQLVTLYENGKEVRMSTRAGEFVTLREILDEVGRDAGRFFFLMRKFDAHLDFDLALAKSQTPDNPVFYIQYAHARVESIKANFQKAGLDPPEADGKVLARLQSPAEMGILRLLAQFPEIVIAADRTLEPYRLVPYLQELAAAFHRFYADHRVVTEDKDLVSARMLLVTSVQTVIRIGLNLLGVSAPLKM
ncbi:MAG: arginine--tRNA ligase [Candidatus Omnitrophica bacterium]|nr:arginine--tRNA ligase [Candidatus Omnitrophota bacterium]